MNDVVVAFLKSLPTYFMHAVMLGKKHQRISTVQEEGLTIEGRYLLLLLQNKRGIEESLHAYIKRARLCVRWTYF